MNLELECAPTAAPKYQTTRGVMSAKHRGALHKPLRWDKILGRGGHQSFHFWICLACSRFSSEGETIPELPSLNGMKIISQQVFVFARGLSPTELL